MKLTKEQKEVWNNLIVVEEGSHYVNYQYKDKKMYMTRCGTTWYYSTSIEDGFGWRADTEEYYDLTKAQVAQVILDKLSGEKHVETALDSLGLSKDQFGDMVKDLAKEFDTEASASVFYRI